MPNSGSNCFHLLDLYKTRQANQVSGFCDFASELKLDDLIEGYRQLKSGAPRRRYRNLKYFVGHNGVTSSGTHSNRREEHLAVALWNQCQQSGPLQIECTGELLLLDYQLPLKARQGDKGIGKVDLFGVTDNSKPSVIELKIHSSNQGMADTPLRAFLEALAYCAIVEANLTDIAQEAFDQFGCEITESRPTLVVMATKEYWSAYLHHQKTGDWWLTLRGLADQLEASFDLESHFLVLRSADFSMGLVGQKPQMQGDCSLMNLADLV
jgi:hypothetical protein